MTTRDQSCAAPSSAREGRRPNSAEDGAAPAKPKRFWPQHKSEAVLRLLRGEAIEIVSRELGVTAAALSEWREIFLQGGAEAFKKRSPKEQMEIRRLNAKIGEQAMENELLREKIAHLEQNRPLARRRSSK